MTKMSGRRRRRQKAKSSPESEMVGLINRNISFSKKTNASNGTNNSNNNTPRKNNNNINNSRDHDDDHNDDMNTDYLNLNLNTSFNSDADNSIHESNTYTKTSRKGTLKSPEGKTNQFQKMISSRHSYPSQNYAQSQTPDATPLLPPFRRSQSMFHHNHNQNNINNNHHPNSYIEHDINEDNFANQFLNTVDMFEDEFDKNAYEELIPLNIRMELENRLFGWNHLYSEFLGHVLFPLTYYLVTFWLVSIIGLKYHPDSVEEGCSTGIGMGVGASMRRVTSLNNLNKTCSTDRCGWSCTFHKTSYHGNHIDHDNDNTDPYNYEPILNISVTAFLFIRQFLSLWAALNAFRTVRRRRRVWLTSTAAEYFKDGKRQDEIKEVDKKTLLGKIRKKIKARRVRKKILRASRQFQKRDTLRRDFITSSSSFENQHHNRVRKLGRSIHDDSDDGKPESLIMFDGIEELSNEEYNDTSTTNMSTEVNPDAFHQNYQKHKFDSQTDMMTANSSDDADESHITNFCARTMSTYAMQSINLDQIRLKSKIENVPYAHGGFFGAAPFMLANPHWIDILRQLMPEVYVEISRRVVRTPVPQLIHWAENNPVVAAYGTAHDLEFSGKLPTLEWDVFLDPHLVQRVEVVLQARDTFLKQLAKTSKRIKALLNREPMECRYSDKMKRVGIILESSVNTRSNEQRILEFYNAEIQKRVEILLENMLIAHGNVSQLFMEQTGLMKNYNFSRVKHTRRTLGGGIFAKHWIPTFVQALRMSTKSEELCQMDESSDESTSSGEDAEDSASSLERSASEDREDYPLMDSSKHQLETKSSFHDLTLAAISPSTIAESISELKRVTVCDAPLGLILDIKSRHVPKRVWALLLDALRKAGARVEGIATFYVEDIRDISKYCSVPVKELIFQHSAGDLQHGIHSGVIERGDSIFFNAGSLFWNNPIRGAKYYSKLIGTCIKPFDVEEVKKEYKFQPYARVRQDEKSKTSKYSNKENDDDLSDDERIRFIDDGTENGHGSTIQQYKEHFALSIGLYVQEFCVDDQIMELLIKYVNKNQHIYNLGLSWGGVNGLTVKGIQPGRLTNTDGLWNQRYLGNRWDSDKYPTTIAPISSSQIT